MIITIVIFVIIINTVIEIFMCMQLFVDEAHNVLI